MPKKRDAIFTGVFMRRWLPILLGLFSCWGIAGCISEQQTGSHRSVDTATEDTITRSKDRGVVYVKTHNGIPELLYENSYALVIGNSHYTNGWPPLKGPAGDVDDVARTLESHGFKVEAKKDLTKAEFDKVFGDFVERYGRGENNRNRLLFYYAGHGYTEQRGSSGDLGYLVMVDAPSPRPEYCAECRRKSISMDFMISQAKLIQSQHVLFMFDSCFGGTIFDTRGQPTPKQISDSVKYPVREFITAGDANQVVPDVSIFKQIFLDLLEGRLPEPIPADGYLTGEELGVYLKNTVPQYDTGQTPQHGKINDYKLSRGDFVFPLPERRDDGPGPDLPRALFNCQLGSKLHIYRNAQDLITAGIPADSKTYITSKRQDPVSDDRVELGDDTQRIEKINFNISYEYHANSNNSPAILEFVLKGENDQEIWRGTRSFRPARTKKNITEEFSFEINRRYQGRQVKIQATPLSAGDFGFYIYELGGTIETSASLPDDRVKTEFLSVCNHPIDENFNADEAISCGSEISLTGRTANIPEGMYLWLLVHPIGSDGYWPQRFAILPHSRTNRWEQGATLGGGERFEIWLVLVDEAGNQFYTDYLERANREHDFPAIAMPSGPTGRSKPIDTVTVVKE